MSFVYRIDIQVEYWEYTGAEGLVKIDEWTITAKNASLEQTLKSNNLLAKVSAFCVSLVVVILCTVSALGTKSISMCNNNIPCVFLYMQKFRELTKDFIFRCYAGDIEVCGIQTPIVYFYESIVGFFCIYSTHNVCLLFLSATTVVL